MCIASQRYWWAKVSGLGAIGDYEELEKFSRQKKSPIGYEPFVDVCLKHGNRKEAAKYIPKCTPDDRYRLYIKIE
jgi:hypothetical protein